jgi:hypothetical protein
MEKARRFSTPRHLDFLAARFRIAIGLVSLANLGAAAVAEEAAATAAATVRDKL